jgi:hypothetical protein
MAGIRPKNAANRKTKNVVKRRQRIDWHERPFRRHLSVSASLFSSSKKIGAQFILTGPKPTASIDVVSPGGQTVSVSVEGVPPSMVPDVVCPPAKGVNPQHRFLTQVGPL